MITVHSFGSFTNHYKLEKALAVLDNGLDNRDPARLHVVQETILGYAFIPVHSVLPNAVVSKNKRSRQCLCRYGVDFFEGRPGLSVVAFSTFR